MSSRVGQKNAARVVRDQIAAEKRRKRRLWTSVIAVAALVIAGLAGWGVYASQRSGSVVPPPNATATSGISVGDGPVTLDVYEDYMCPHCKEFETRSGATLDQLVAQHKAKVNYHTLAFLDASSTTNYSTRSAAAAACADEGGKFRDYAKALFARQPAEGGPGLSDGELISVGTSVGLNEGSFGSCVQSGRYKSWVAAVTDAGASQGVTGTPTVKVAGTQVADLSPAGLTQAVTAAS
jgi:protein-disulfide isomerase